ncbi:unnamed protein product [Paramecium primaurelia]|uniref:G domain-containing protein n=1 Tax=Paramecium primaurelia TaxID=5886 RepID=A0A8S1MVV4_PARPR|nr:unnamed protein product [Paramecium primaurelia]
MQKILENEFDFSCIQQHGLPICALILDPKLNAKERLLCSQCINNLEKEENILGWRKVIDRMKSHLEDKYQINSKLISSLLLLLKQMKSNLEQLQESMMNQLQNIEEIIDKWKKELQKETNLLESHQILDELDYLFGNQQSKVSFEEQLLRELKKINSNHIVKIQQEMKFFKKFEQYKICLNILNSIKEQKYYSQTYQQINQMENEAEINNNEQSDFFKNSSNKKIDQDIIKSNTGQFVQQQYEQRQIQQRKVEIIELKQGLSLPLIKLQTNKDGDPQYQYEGQQRNDKIQYKKIIFIGQRDEGKTTLLNAFVNYYFGITWDDNFRLIVANQVQTTDISHYYIEPFKLRKFGIHLIDTPGNYGQNDRQTINKVSTFIQDNYNTIDIIVVCFKATNVRLNVEANQMLQSIVQIIGQQIARKIIVARTFYSGGGEVDQSILTSEQSPFYQLSQYLNEDFSLEFNAQSIVKITQNQSAKVYHDISISNFKKIENLIMSNIYNINQKGINSISNQTQQLQKFNNVDSYSEVYQSSYNQLKLLFLQNLKVYFSNQKQPENNQQQLIYAELQKYSLYQVCALNCKQCQITCFVGFKSLLVANDFLNKEINGKCYCGCSMQNMIAMNEQWFYKENNVQYWKDNQGCIKILYEYLYKLFQRKEKKDQSQINEQQFIEILEKEEYQNQQIIQQFKMIFLQQIQKQQIQSTPIVNQQSNQVQYNQYNQNISSSSSNQNQQQQNNQASQKSSNGKKNN